MQSVGILQWMACLAPIGVLFCSVTFVRAKVPTAAAAGLITTIISAAAIGALSADALARGIFSGAGSALSILYAIWPAIFLYDIMRQSGAFDILRASALRATEDSLVLILFFGWIFSSFLQSITGFGVPVAVCAPFLVALGVHPVAAVIMTLIGHSWGNTYGTLAMAWDALVHMGPVEHIAETAFLTSALLWLLNLSGGIILCCIYGGRKAIAHGLPFVLVMSAIMGGGQLLVSCFDQTIAAFMPTAVAMATCIAMFKMRMYVKPWACPSRVANPPKRCECDKTAPDARETIICASPFVFLAAASLLAFAIPTVKSHLDAVRMGNVAPLCHAGFVLALTCLFALFIMRRRLEDGGLSLACSAAISKLWSVSAGIILLVIMARILQTTGQMNILASGVAQAAGEAYVPFAPALGTFGAFVTSSNMSSNILLAGFQHAMAQNLAADPALLLAAQTAGGAAGAAIGPSTILLGAATVGASGREGEILRPLLAVSFAQALVFGAILAAVVACS